MTGFIGEFFGAVQAVKVATAEKNVIGYFHKLNDERRILTIREKLFDEVLGSIYRNTSTLGTGVILILVGQSMRTGNFTLGDFSLFVYLLQSMGDLTTFGGMLCGALQTTGCLRPAHVSPDGKRAVGRARRTQQSGFGWSAARSDLPDENRIRPTERAGR